MDGLRNVHIKLLVRGYSGDSDGIVKLLGITPSRIWRSGEPTVPGAAVLHKDNGVIFEPSTPSQQAGFIEQMELLTKLIVQHKSAFNMLPKDSRIIVYCVIHDPRAQVIKIDSTIIALFAEIGASVEMDAY